MPSYSEERQSNYSAKQLYSLITDIAEYPKFLPWCSAIRQLDYSHASEKQLQKQNYQVQYAEMFVSFGLASANYISQIATKASPKRYEVLVTAVEGPFEYLHNNWVFIPNKHGCLIQFHIDFNFKSGLYNKMITQVMDKAISKIINSFEQRARQLF